MSLLFYVILCVRHLFVWLYVLKGTVDKWQTKQNRASLKFSDFSWAHFWINIYSPTTLTMRGIKWHFLVWYWLYISVQYSEITQLHCTPDSSLSCTFVVVVVVVVEPFLQASGWFYRFPKLTTDFMKELQPQTWDYSIYSGHHNSFTLIDLFLLSTQLIHRAVESEYSSIRSFTFDLVHLYARKDY